MNHTTVFSPDRAYRYTLWREWSLQEIILTVEREIDPRPMEYVQFIGLNPSVADETIDDNTIRRCIDFAKRWGYGGLCMTNLFAWRDTKPAKMKKVVDPVGPDNNHWLEQITREAGLVVCCWGVHGEHRGRDADVLALPSFQERQRNNSLFSFGHTEDGLPKHPLMLAKLTQLEPLRPRTAKPQELQLA
jgi:hypothetical protein